VLDRLLDWQSIQELPGTTKKHCYITTASKKFNQTSLCMLNCLDTVRWMTGKTYVLQKVPLQQFVQDLAYHRATP